MIDHSVEAVPVIDEAGRLVGIVSESDLVRWLVP
jgi:CBS domain-containing protein